MTIIKKNINLVIISIGIVFLIIASFNFYSLVSKSEVTFKPKSTITISATGDFIPHDAVSNNALTDGDYDYTNLVSEQLKPLLQSDITFCNAETVLTNDNDLIQGYPSFRAPIKFAKDLNTLGCNLINTANNHIMDFYAPEALYTQQVWEEQDVLAVNGVFENQAYVSYFDIDDTTFSYITINEYSNNQDYDHNMMNRLDKAILNPLLEEAKTKSDFTIVSVHWIVDGELTPTNEQKQWANYFAQNQVDLVIGTGPHVLQPVEEITNNDHTTLVAYSLGNFLSSQLLENELIGAIMQIELEKKDDKVIISNYQLTPTFTQYKWLPSDSSKTDYNNRTDLKVDLFSNSKESFETMFDSNYSDFSKQLQNTYQEQLKD